MVTVSNDVSKLRLYGWIAFETAIDVFGYAVDGKATLETAPSNAEQNVINAGGEYAKRMDIFADISALEAGTHNFDFLVRINMADGSTAVLKIASFTLIIE